MHPYTVCGHKLATILKGQMLPLNFSRRLPGAWFPVPNMLLNPERINCTESSNDEVTIILGIVSCH
jgi:hypothetical protein